MGNVIFSNRIEFHYALWVVSLHVTTTFQEPLYLVAKLFI